MLATEPLELMVLAGGGILSGMGALISAMTGLVIAFRKGVRDAAAA
jgi:hypothetical protein